jgi:hypothetical protein
MGFLSFMISGLMITLGILIQTLFPEQQIGVLIRNYAGIPVYLLSELVQNLMKNMGNNRVAARILIKYSNDIDNSIKENVFDISDISSIEEFLDYKFIYSQTEYELMNKKIYINESLLDEVYNKLDKNYKQTKFSGLLLGDIGTGKTTLINEFLLLPNHMKGLTETIAGESITVGPPIRYNNPNYLPWLVLYDTQGFDKDTDFIKSIDNMKQFIENQFNENDTNEFVNFIIYCINGERFIESEKKNIIMLRNLYPASKLQIIVVNTRGLNANAESLLNKIKHDMEKNYNINDIIYIPISAIKSGIYNPMTKKIDEYGTYNMNKLLETIINITENSLSSTIYKLYLEKLKKLHKNNMDNIINKIGEKNITGFDANYKMVIEKCLKINVDKSILNTMQTHYFKVSEKNKSGKNIEDNIRKMKDEYDKEGGKEGLDKDTIENYRNIYIEKVSQKSIEGLLVLMKKLMCENFIFKDIIDHLEKSHRIKFYVDNIVKNFKKSIKAK